MNICEGVNLGPESLNAGNEILEIVGPQMIIFIARAAIGTVASSRINLRLGYVLCSQICVDWVAQGIRRSLPFPSGSNLGLPKLFSRRKPDQGTILAAGMISKFELWLVFPGIDQTRLECLPDIINIS